MKNLGFRYDLKKKVFYVDGHEKPAQRFDRKVFVQMYLQELEPQMHRWISLPITELNRLRQDELESLSEELGYRYTDKTTGLKMIEFHVDDHSYLFKRAT